MKVETVDDGVVGDRARAVLGLWERHGVLSGDEAHRRLGEVVCVLVDDDGGLRGTSSAAETAVPMLGGRRFWFYRRFVAPEVGPAYDVAMLTAAFEALARRFADHGGPIGVCTVVDAEVARRYPQAVWPESGMLHAGFNADGHQVRIRYFDEARL